MLEPVSCSSSSRDLLSPSNPGGYASGFEGGSLALYSRISSSVSLLKRKYDTVEGKISDVEGVNSGIEAIIVGGDLFPECSHGIGN